MQHIVHLCCPFNINSSLVAAGFVGEDNGIMGGEGVGVEDDAEVGEAAE
jgi:hypothetical protein